MQYPVTEQDGFMVVALSGDIDLSTSPEARKAILAALEHGKGVLVDLAGVAYLDSSGVASLVEAFQLARGQQQPFGLVGVSDSALSVLKLARLDTVFPIHATVAEAGNPVTS